MNRNDYPYSQSASCDWLKIRVELTYPGTTFEQKNENCPDRIFRAATKLCTDRMRVNRNAGLNVTKHKLAIPAGDEQKLIV